MTRFLSLLVVVPLFAASPEAEIRKVLDDQTAAWNRGDVRGFMEGYDKSESTTRFGVGTLNFSEVEIRHLWRRPGGDTGGIFTLLFHKLPVGWRMILDHTH